MNVVQYMVIHWRHFNAPYKGPDADYTGTVDQLAEIISQIKENPTSRRMIMSAWNPSQLKDMCLPPYHVMYQFYVDNGFHIVPCINVLVICF